MRGLFITIIISFTIFTVCQSEDYCYYDDNFELFYETYRGIPKSPKRLHMAAPRRHYVDTVKGINYIMRSNGEAYIIKSEEHKKITGRLTIPSSINYNNHQYKVKTIKREAFSGCHKITEVAIYDNIKLIEEEAFSNCMNLSKAIINAETIGDRVFYDCVRLDTVDLGDNVREIGYWSFGNTSLEKLGIPKCTTCLNPLAFIKNVDVDKNNVKYCSIDGVAYTKDTTELIRVPINTEILVVYTKTRRIREGAAAYCNNLREVIFPQELEYIEDYAFYDCANLEKIAIPKKIKNISNTAFLRCKKLDMTK